MPDGVTVAPFGVWPSPLTAEMAAEGGARYAGVALGGVPGRPPTVWWSAAEGGRNSVYCLRPGGTGERIEQVDSARTRVNEYGGGAFWVHGDTLFWVEDDDQRLRRLGPPDDSPVLLTAPGPGPRAWRYAAGVVHPDGDWMVVEREVHAAGEGEPPEPQNDLGWLPARPSADGPVDGGGDAHRLVGGADFVVAPSLSSDGTLLAWLRWDHPDMPWDAAELWAGEILVADDIPQVRAARRVAGGRRGASDARSDAVAACLPLWSPEGRLHWCDDREDLWWLRHAEEPGLPAEGSGDTAAAVASGGEVGTPRWVSGGSRYGFGPNRLVLVETQAGLDRLRMYRRDPATGEVDTGSGGRGPSTADAELGPELTSLTWTDGVVVSGDTVAVVAGFPATPTGVVCWEPDHAEVVHDTPWPLAEDSISVPEPVAFPTPPSAVDGDVGREVAHGLFFPPRLAGVAGEPGELPPLVVRIHGGPTANARAELSPSVQFWTTRGFAVLEVNYRGSVGYGRDYRERLRGGWGELEVQDCIAGAEHQVTEGRVDPRRCVIRGGSAGGFTALEAVSAPPTATGFRFAAATTLYGVTDLMALARDTHKFESHYLDGLVGPLPEAAELYAERSPLHHAERITAPVLVLQGLEDPIVPPSQAEVLVAALAANGIDHEYRTYEGEGHGFRRTGTVRDALEVELAFYQRILGLHNGGERVS